jgi:uncharacterized membrane protein
MTNPARLLTPAAPHVIGRSPLVAAGIVGVALGGFFDGILLHQVLQWHHLLSLVPGEALRDLRNQILADGAFHVLMYLVAGVGLWLLWKSRDRLAGPGSGRRLLGAALLGFGAWQFVDVVLFHWILGIHRIRVDVPAPLPWDIGWLVVFGLPSIAAGAWLLRQGRADGSSGDGRLVGAGLAALALAAGPIAALPPPGATSTIALFRPGLGPVHAYEAVAAIKGRIMWADPSGEFVVFEPAADMSAAALYFNGALLVGGSAMAAGCLSWADAERL